MVSALAVDLGSSSGRVLVGRLRDERIDVDEVHRFAHEAREDNGQLVWDLERLWQETLVGLRLGLNAAPDAQSVSIDTWGVDFVALDEQNQQVGPARTYRDERTTRTWDAFCQLVSDEEFFSLTGIAPATINSVNQLVALRMEEPELAAKVSKVLFLPDYFTWRLTGQFGWSRSIASTSGLCVPGAKEWSNQVFERTMIPADWFGDLTDELSVAGRCQVEGLRQLQVVRAGAHDTACAVHGLAIEAGTAAHFLSCGSWSVLGALVDEPIIGPRAFQIGVTNEVRTDGGVRPLFNITGLWILQECQREWGLHGETSSIVELVQAAGQAPSLGYLIDPDDPVFVAPGNMVQRVRTALRDQGAPEPQSAGQLVRVVLESFAARYAKGIADLAALTGVQPTQLNLVGGGARNTLLCRLTAAAAGIEVVAGPAEAATLGAMLGQFETLGHLERANRARIIAASTQTARYLP